MTGRVGRGTGGTRDISIRGWGILGYMRKRGNNQSRPRSTAEEYEGRQVATLYKW